MSRPTQTLLACLMLLLGAGVSAQQPAVAIPKGINATFKDPDLNVDDWIGRFEVESREVFSARREVLAACDVRPGERVADVGAGTGFYSQLFAKAAGPSGRVYSVDIAPKFLEHIDERALAAGLRNVTTVLGADDSVCLPPESVDLVFICDTYHHFESPQRSLASIYRSLKPGGRLVLIDFERIPGKSSEFVLGHVRAGKGVFRSEIVDAGFEFKDEIEVDSFEENYLLRFVRPKD
ncbi:Demethylrebeccamycin-D-glucose O-methyltransferase [Pirellulimonas nuda]|uniref:Demethylrebeccamycin-D-glucose O-methyltransferase n=1 Tax=Pirellulimonas nuda TaxID=2528009 RepID=A0A518DDV8_9BACT|nr:methyltransferase domain-containing protein [Pirellulimonas nuda]QDU89665.1 Demethylrebeccamycin-D-glucose O-methyltransferase [Pirellulimonas nuda]